MVDEELVKALSEPILEKIEELEKQYKNEMIQLPQIRIVREGDINEPMMIGDQELNDELIAAVEAYVQNELEMRRHRTVMH
ncbi:MAG: hypothetical protein J6E46_08470 [Faecalicoccus sp.]|nr:hypothetical protein [Faecalicoccus sp.]